MSSQHDLIQNNEQISIFIPYQRPNTFTPTPPTQSGLYWLFDLNNAPLVYLHRIGSHSEARPAIDEIRRITHEQVDRLIDELVEAEAGLGKEPKQEQGRIGNWRSETSFSSIMSADADAKELSREEVDAGWDLDQAAEPRVLLGHRHESNRQCSSPSPMRSTQGTHHSMRKDVLIDTSGIHRDSPLVSGNDVGATVSSANPVISAEESECQQEEIQQSQETKVDDAVTTWPRDRSCD